MLRPPLICPGKSNSKYDVHDGSDDHDDTYDTHTDNEKVIIIRKRTRDARELPSARCSADIADD